MPYEITSNFSTFAEPATTTPDDCSTPVAPFSFQRWVPSVMPYENDTDFAIFTDASGYVYNFRTYEQGENTSESLMWGFSVNTNNPNATIDDSAMVENFSWDWYLELSMCFDSSTSSVIVQPIINEGLDRNDPTYITIGNVDISDYPTGFNYFRDYANNWENWSDYESGFGFLLESYTPWYNPTI